MSSYNYGNISLNTGYSTSYNITGPDIDWANVATQTLTIGPYNTGATGATGSIFTTSGSNGSTWNIANPTPKVHLTKDGLDMGEDCDIKIGDWSLKDFARKMEERLAILSPNPKLEADWAELKELGDRYRELEKDIKEKMKTWDVLKRED